MAAFTAAEVRAAIEARPRYSEPIGRDETEDHLRKVVEEMAYVLRVPISDAEYHAVYEDERAATLLGDQGDVDSDIWSIAITPRTGRGFPADRRETLRRATAAAKEAIIEGAMEYAAAVSDALLARAAVPA